MHINDKTYLNEYESAIEKSLSLSIAGLDSSDIASDLSYLTKTSAVYSSNIEGNSVNLNSFMNYEMNKKSIKPTKELSEIEDLIKAYDHAKKHTLNEDSLLECHKILSAQLLIASKRGQYRSEKVGVFGDTGLIYLAVEPEYLPKEMKIFWKDINSLINDKNLSQEAAFYHAALIHLRFAHLHPFMDGNGRLARLLEKWFLAQKLGEKLWNLQSERYYFHNRSKYYQNINLGVNFYELDYSKSLPFLLMLPSAASDIA